jgi:hypothetical protein
MSLDKLIASFPAVTSLEQLQVMVSQELKNPWDMSTGKDKVIILPSNYQQLYKDNYLIALFLNIIHNEGYKYQVCNVEYITRLKLTTQNTIFLKSFGLFPLTGKIPSIPNQKGYIWKGISSSLRLWLIAKKKVDISLFKVKDAVHPAVQIFGDIWGASYPMEKKMLDHIIHYIRLIKESNGISDYLIPIDQIAANKGLHLDYTSDVVREVEKSYIKNSLQLLKIEPRWDGSKFKISNNLDGIFALEEEILNRQKLIKEPKDIIKGIISDRVISVFAPYKDKNRDKARKTPIKDLITNLKGTEYYRSFNPVRWFQILGLSPLPSVYKKDINEEFLEEQLKLFCNSIEEKGGNNTLISSVYQEYKVFLRDLQ